MMMIYMIYQVLGVYLSFVYVNVIAIYMCMYAVGYICVCWLVCCLVLLFIANCCWVCCCLLCFVKSTHDLGACNIM